VLAGRVGVGRLVSARVYPAAWVVGAAYLAIFVLSVSLAPHDTSARERSDWLADRSDWLVRNESWMANHHLTYGLGQYWEASSVTVRTGGAVQIRAVLPGKQGVHRHLLESDASWYDPSLHRATFVVVDDSKLDRQQAEASFGPPVEVYELEGRTILVWNKNLLTDLAPASDEWLPTGQVASSLQLRPSP
jgi:hypothetical protein